MGRADPKKPKNSQGRPSGRQKIAPQGRKNKPESTGPKERSASAEIARSTSRATDEQSGGGSEVVSRRSASEASGALRPSTIARPGPAHAAVERATSNTPFADAGLMASITSQSGIIGHGLAVASLVRQAESAFFEPLVTAERIGERQRQLQQMLATASAMLSRECRLERVMAQSAATAAMQNHLGRIMAPTSATTAMQRRLEQMMTPSSATALQQLLQHMVAPSTAVSAAQRQLEQMISPSRVTTEVQTRLEQLARPSSMASGAFRNRADQAAQSTVGIATQLHSAGAGNRAMRPTEEAMNGSAARISDLGSRHGHYASLTRISQNEARSYLETLTTQHRIGVGVLAGINELQAFASTSALAGFNSDLLVHLGITLSAADALRKRAWHAIHGVGAAVPFDTLTSIRSVVLRGGADSTWVELARNAAATLRATTGLGSTGVASQLLELSSRGSLPSEVAQIAAGVSPEQAASIDVVERILARVPDAEWAHLSQASLSSAFAEAIDGRSNSSDTEPALTADFQAPSSIFTSSSLGEFALVATDALMCGERDAADDETRALFVELRSRIERLESSSKHSALSLSIGVASLIIGVIPLLPALNPAAGTFLLLALVLLVKQHDERGRG